MSADQSAKLPLCNPTFSARGLASMIGASLMVLPLYAAAIGWLVRACGWHWRWAPGVYLGAASMVVGLGILFVVGWRAAGKPNIRRA